MAAVGTFLITALYSSLQAEVDEALRLRATQIEQRIDAGGNELLRPGEATGRLLERAPLEEFAAPGIYVQLRDAQGMVTASSPNLPEGQIPVSEQLLPLALQGQETYATLPAGSDRLRVLALPVVRASGVVGVVLVAESLHSNEVAVARAQQLLLLSGGTAALAALLTGWWLTSRALSPIREMTRVARRIASTGSFEQRVPDPGTPDELGELSLTLNEMLDRIEATLQRQKEFIANASHDLRTPLAVMRGNLDILSMELSPADRVEAVAEASQEVDRMAQMVTDLLFLAEMDAKSAVAHQPVALHQVVGAVFERLKRVDGDRHRLILANNDMAIVSGDQHRLEQMLWNLVDNATRHTPENGTITLSLRRQGSIAEVTVADTGEGIPAAHLSRIFDRFYRVEQGRSRQSGGAGLGLAIVKQVAEAHGGRVWVHSEVGTGTTFTVELPAPERP